MAKLSARGRTEVKRVTRESLTPTSDTISWERTTVVLMSDGNILSKRDVKFRADNRAHSYGWVVKGKIKDVTPDQWATKYRDLGYV